jgi:Uncharacterized alpha/beta hydrolase domain (DUF2235)
MVNELSPLLLPDHFIPTGPESTSTSKISPHPNACFSCTPPYEHAREWIPNPEDKNLHPAKTLILCFDGTGDSFDEDVSVLLHTPLSTLNKIIFFFFLQNSNVVQFLSMLKKDQPTEQLVYYQVRSILLSPSLLFPTFGLT